jgi:hypothetical protein
MERAQKVEEVIAVQRELTNVRGQIERIEGRRRFLERRSEFTTINLTLRDVRASTSGRQSGWDLKGTLEDALSALTESLQVLGRIAIWLVVMFPVYGLPFLLIWWLVRRRRHPAPRA